MSTKEAIMKMRVCDYRHEKIKEGSDLQVRIISHMGVINQFSKKKLFMFGCDYAFTFIQRISEYNPEDFEDLRNEDETTKHVVAFQGNEDDIDLEPIWTRRIRKNGQWEWEDTAATNIIEWMPVCNHVSISRQDDDL